MEQYMRKIISILAMSMLLMMLGALSANASDKCGASKSGGAMPTSKCGAGKSHQEVKECGCDDCDNPKCAAKLKERTECGCNEGSSMKCGAGKCGASMKK
jgi:hypothetical protein